MNFFKSQSSWHIDLEVLRLTPVAFSNMERIFYVSSVQISAALFLKKFRKKQIIANSKKAQITGLVRNLCLFVDEFKICQLSLDFDQFLSEAVIILCFYVHRHNIL